MGCSFSSESDSLTRSDVRQAHAEISVRSPIQQGVVDAGEEDIPRPQEHACNGDASRKGSLAPGTQHSRNLDISNDAGLGTMIRGLQTLPRSSLGGSLEPVYSGVEPDSPHVQSSSVNDTLADLPWQVRRSSVKQRLSIESLSPRLERNEALDLSPIREAEDILSPLYVASSMSMSGADFEEYVSLSKRKGSANPLSSRHDASDDLVNLRSSSNEISRTDMSQFVLREALPDQDPRSSYLDSSVTDRNIVARMRYSQVTPQNLHFSSLGWMEGEDNQLTGQRGLLSKSFHGKSISPQPHKPSSSCFGIVSDWSSYQYEGSEGSSICATIDTDSQILSFSTNSHDRESGSSVSRQNPTEIVPQNSSSEQNTSTSNDSYSPDPSFATDSGITTLGRRSPVVGTSFPRRFEERGWNAAFMQGVGSGGPESSVSSREHHLVESRVLRPLDGTASSFGYASTAAAASSAPTDGQPNEILDFELEYSFREKEARSSLPVQDSTPGIQCTTEPAYNVLDIRQFVPSSTGDIQESIEQVSARLGSEPQSCDSGPEKTTQESKSSSLVESMPKSIESQDSDDVPESYKSRELLYVPTRDDEAIRCSISPKSVYGEDGKHRPTLVSTPLFADNTSTFSGDDSHDHRVDVHDFVPDHVYAAAKRELKEGHAWETETSYTNAMTDVQTVDAENDDDAMTRSIFAAYTADSSSIRSGSILYRSIHGVSSNSLRFSQLESAPMQQGAFNISQLGGNKIGSGNVFSSTACASPLSTIPSGSTLQSLENGIDRSGDSACQTFQ